MGDAEKIKKMKEEAIKKGGIFAKLYFQIFGKTEESTLNLAKGFAASISQMEGVVVSASEIQEAIKEEKYFSTYVEAYVVVKNFNLFIKLLSDTTPFSLEVIEPTRLSIENGILSNSLQEMCNYVFLLKQKLYEANPQQRGMINKMAEHRLKLGEKIKEK